MEESNFVKNELQQIKLEIDQLVMTDEQLNIGSTLEESFQFIVEYKKKIIESIPTFRKKSYEYWLKMSSLVAELESRKNNLSEKQEELMSVQNQQYEVSRTKKLYTKNLKIQENELSKLYRKFTKNDRRIEAYENRVLNSSKLKSRKVSNLVNMIFQTHNKNKIIALKDKLSQTKSNSIDLSFVIDKQQNIITDTSKLYADNQIHLVTIQQKNIILRQEIQVILESISENSKEISNVEEDISKNTETLKSVSSSLVDIIEQQTRLEANCLFHTKETEQTSISSDSKSLNMPSYSDLTLEAISGRSDAI